MKKIFISHRSSDSVLVDELVQYLENIGVDKKDIMYTSADSSGVQFDLGLEIKAALNEADMFIVILSPNYYDSVYCCNELGFIWATGKTPIVFGLPGIDNNKDYKGFINEGWLIRRLNNSNHIDFLFEQIQGFSKKDFTSPVLPNEYKNAYLLKVNKALETYSMNKEVKSRERYLPEKIIDIDSLIQNFYYTNKELLFFKYIADKNDYIFGTAEDLRIGIRIWEKSNRLHPFLSENLEGFLIMLTNKHYLSCQTITRKETLAQLFAGNPDDSSKFVLKYLGTDENGNRKLNFFTMDERLFRAIANINEESKSIIEHTLTNYKLKWYQRYPKTK